MSAKLSAVVTPHKALNTRLRGWDSILEVMKKEGSCEQGRDRVSDGCQNEPSGATWGMGGEEKLETRELCGESVHMEEDKK